MTDLSATTLHGSNASLAPAPSRVADYVALLKPRVMSLVVFTGLVGLWLAPGDIHPVLGAVAIVAIALGAGASGAINMWYDRDIDAVMTRTRNRPIPTGAVAPDDALGFGVLLSIFSVALMIVATNAVAGGLLALTILFYVFVYTAWLKRRTPHNIVIGGAAGAVPVLVGWSAVTGTLDWPPVLLFGVIFIWTPPHFWALAIRYRDDYAAAAVPMLPSVREARTVAVRIIGYTLALWALTIAFSPVAGMGNVYLGSAIALGAVFTWFAAQLLRDASPKAAMRVFGWSITYITLLFGAMAVDQLVRTGV
jgi:heme o synthase